MATTTNYGWTTPDNTDLVKDGAAAIRTLGSAIDTSMNTALGTKKAGMVLLNTQTFTTASSVSFPTNTFTSAFNVYHFEFDLTGSTALQLLGRLRAAGVDNSSTNYRRANWEGSPVGASTNTGETSWIVGEFHSSDQQRRGQGFTVRDPQVSGRYTSGFANFLSNVNSTPYPILRWTGIDVTTSYDSMTFLTNTGTVTGSISCYGFQE